MCIRIFSLLYVANETLIVKKVNFQLISSKNKKKRKTLFYCRKESTFSIYNTYWTPIEIQHAMEAAMKLMRGRL
jgi:hypothetical protein